MKVSESLIRHNSKETLAAYLAMDTAGKMRMTERVLLYHAHSDDSAALCGRKNAGVAINLIRRKNFVAVRKENALKAKLEEGQRTVIPIQSYLVVWS